jgi:hypothetical protein
MPSTISDFQSLDLNFREMERLWVGVMYGIEGLAKLASFHENSL